MPASNNITPALQEARSIFPKNVREIDTLEVNHPDLIKQNRNIDAVFLVDISGSMDTYIEDVKNSLQGLLPLIEAEFETVRFGILTFKDEDEIDLPLGAAFVTVGELETYLATVASSGGGDTPEAGMKAVVDAVNSFPWNPSSVSTVILLTDTDSHERGATYEQAASACESITAYFLYLHVFPYTWETYNNLVAATNGAAIEFVADSQILADRISDAILSLEIISSGTQPFFLVNDNRDLTAFLETGEEVTFVRRNFGVNLMSSGEDGTRFVNITIDNTDKEVSKFIAQAKTFRTPIEITFRSYLSNDLSQPQNLSPVKLYMSNAVSKGSSVSGQAKWIDIQNMGFPNTYYTRKRFPSL